MSKLSDLNLEEIILSDETLASLLKFMSLNELCRLCLNDLAQLCKQCNNPILERNSDYLNVMQSAIDHGIIDKDFRLTNKRGYKEKFAAIIIQLYYRGYFKKFVGDKKIKYGDIIKFVKQEFHFDMSNYLYRDALRIKLNKMSVLCQIDLNETRYRR